MSYYQDSRQPIHSAVLVLPFILVYEIGLIFLRSDVINGGDAILLNLGGPIFRLMGIHGSFVSVLVLIGLFVAWQIRRKGSWKISPPVVVGMFFESLAWAVLLYFLLTHLLQYFPRAAETHHEQLAAMATNRPRIPAVQDFVLYCGAGVYEELVFRVLLLTLLMLGFTKLLHMEHAHAAVWSVLLGAVIFSGFHHFGGEPFGLNVFLQRAFAGLYFAAIYFNRSFGIAAASHALYDILVGLGQMLNK